MSDTPHAKRRGCHPDCAFFCSWCNEPTEGIAVSHDSGLVCYACHATLIELQARACAQLELEFSAGKRAKALARITSS